MESVRGFLFTKDCCFAPGQIEYTDGIIQSVTLLSEEELSPSEKETLLFPGLVDIHSHGCFGCDTCEGDPEGIMKMVSFERAHGITSYCPTTMTLDEDTLAKAVSAVSQCQKKTNVIKGIYLEGPFISKDKCGAQNPEYILKPDIDMVERLNTAADGLVKIVSVAPEIEGASEFIKKAAGRYVVSIAHTNACYDIAMDAISLGASHITHFYNAMPPYSHRNPGVIGAAMDSADVKIELICDGIHVHPAVVRNTFRQFGADRIILISDSMEATGLPDGRYHLGGQEVIVNGRTATLSDGTIAGSVSTLYDCMCEAVKMGVPIEQAIISATKIPATEIGIYGYTGSLEPGKNADILVTDRNLNLIRVI